MVGADPADGAARWVFSGGIKPKMPKKQPIFPVIKKDSSCLSLCSVVTYKKDGEISQVDLVGVD